MKTLLLLRHAKSSWDDDNLPDHDRPLNERGRRDAPRIGKILRREDLIPDLIISSTAVRAVATAKKVASAASFEGEIRHAEKLYLAEPGEYIALARQVPDEIGTLLLVGHNPGIEGLVQWLTGQDERMPTAALACIRLPIAAWKELRAEKRYELAGVLRPKEL